MKKIPILVCVIILCIIAWVYLIKPQVNEESMQDTNTFKENSLPTDSYNNLEGSQENSIPDGTKDTTQISDMVTNSTVVTTQEKEAMISAFFNFEKLLDGKNPDLFLAYVKKSHPGDQKVLTNVSEIASDFAEGSAFLRMFGGYDDLKASDFRSTKTTWKKQGNVVKVDVETMVDGASSTYHPQFINQSGIWYVDMNK